MNKYYIITGIIVLISILTSNTQAQDLNFGKGLEATSSHFQTSTNNLPTEIPTAESLKLMQRNIKALKERMMLLKSSGVKEDVLAELNQIIQGKQEKLTQMTEKFAALQETVEAKYEKALALKNKLAEADVDLEHLSAAKLAQLVGIPQDELSLENINYLLKTQQVTGELKAQLEGYANKLKADDAKALADNQLNKVLVLQFKRRISVQK